MYQNPDDPLSVPWTHVMEDDKISTTKLFPGHPLHPTNKIPAQTHIQNNIFKNSLSKSQKYV